MFERYGGDRYVQIRTKMSKSLRCEFIELWGFTSGVSGGGRVDAVEYNVSYENTTTRRHSSPLQVAGSSAAYL